MRAFNLGCGPEIFKDGYMGFDEWRNVDLNYVHDDVENYDLTRETPPIDDGYDFVLINHVLCTMKPEIADCFLINAKKLLKNGGKIMVIDMDLLKAFKSYSNSDWNGVGVGDLGSDDAKLCMHVSGYGTRLSLYTPKSLMDTLEYLKLKNPKHIIESPFDIRSKESVIVEATK